MNPEERHNEIAELFRARMEKYVGETTIDKPLMERLAQEIHDVLQSLREPIDPPLITVKPDGPERVKVIVLLNPPVDNMDVNMEI